MRKNCLFMIMFATVTLMGCSKNDASPAESDLPIDQNPTEVFATFKISAPANMQTKATNSGTAGETAVKTLHVFIYDVASPPPRQSHLSVPTPIP